MKKQGSPPQQEQSSDSSPQQQQRRSQNQSQPYEEGAQGYSQTSQRHASNAFPPNFDCESYRSHRNQYEYDHINQYRQYRQYRQYEYVYDNSFQQSQFQMTQALPGQQSRLFGQEVSRASSGRRRRPRKQYIWDLPKKNQGSYQKPQQQQWNSSKHRDQQEKVRDQQQDTKNSSMQQQQQITPDVLAAKTEKLDMTSSTMKNYQTCIPEKQEMKEYSEKSIKVLANMFKITFDNKSLTKAFHYDVDITNKSSVSNKFSKALSREIFEKCRSEHFIHRYPAFDGKKNAYCANCLLPFGNTLETAVKIRRCNCSDNCNKINHSREFTIILKKVNEIDLSWMGNLPFNFDKNDKKYQIGIQVLDIIMRHEPESQHINVGGSFFWKDKLNEGDLTNGLDAACGGFLSVVLGQQLYLNLDVAHKAFVRPQTISNLMKQYNQNIVDKLLKGLKVTYEIPGHIPGHNKRSYRLSRLGTKKANEQKFDCVLKDGKHKTVTVTNYFFERYGYKLQNPNDVCALAVVEGQEIYLPPELCTIESGQSVKKLNDRQTSSMIKIAKMSAPKRQEKIKNQVFKKLVKKESNIMSREFPLSVNDQMEEVNARILDAPNIIYYNKTENVSKGKWQMQKFKQPVNLETREWTILELSKDLSKQVSREDMDKFMKKLQDYAVLVGMRMEEAHTREFKNLHYKETAKIKNYFQKNKKLKLIIVIIPDFSGATYNEIKQITELELGVLTQCIKLKNFDTAISARGGSIIKNILLKINTKLNGINHTLNTELSKKYFEKTMFVGADVTHPSRDENTSSIAAVTASNDIHGFQYNVIHKVLPSRKEIISDLDKIIEVQLSIYKNKTSCLPERIIYYRDGVSEGQLSQVECDEVNAIRRACKNNDIKITCVVVQKRHHVRLFPKNEKDSDDINKNVKAGTIVDSEIVEIIPPKHINFYLVSHASIQGTARPTKYRCILNECEFTEDEIEKLTYHLCHLYARCTRTVSYPVPTYYAHLAAYRGKVLLQGHLDNNLEAIQERLNTNLRLMTNLPMYFV